MCLKKLEKLECVDYRIQF